jgi:hypothetical protein
LAKDGSEGWIGINHALNVFFSVAYAQPRNLTHCDNVFDKA